MVGIVIVDAGQGCHDLLRVEASLASHAWSAAGFHDRARASPSGWNLLDVSCMGAYLTSFCGNSISLVGGFELIGQRVDFGSELVDLHVFLDKFLFRRHDCCCCQNPWRNGVSSV